MSTLRIRGLCVHLEGRLIIGPLDLDVAPGERLVLAGASGSGKTTLLRAIAGLVPLTAGSIELDGERIDHLPPGARRVAMMFQSHALFPHLDVAANLGFGLKARGARDADIQTRVRAVAERLGLERLLSRLPTSLSGGERQRVALGRALLRDARLFLMDEPLSSLDAPLRTRARGELLQLLRERSSPTLYVTHDQAEALAFADRLGVFARGRMLQLAPPRLIYRQPASLEVARFIGVPSINLLPLSVDAAGVHWQQLRLPIEAPPHTPLLLGLRPEQIRVEGSQWARPMTGAPHGTARIESVETLGDQQIVALSVGTERLLARVEAEFAAVPLQTVQIALDLREACLFNAEDGRRIAP